MFSHKFELSISIRVGTLTKFSLPKCDPWPLVLFAMDNTLYASMDVVECNMPCVCENASMSVNPHNCDDKLLEYMGVVDIPNDKLFKKKAKEVSKEFEQVILWKWWFDC